MMSTKRFFTYLGLFSLFIIPAFGVFELYTITITPRTTTAQLPVLHNDKYNFPACTGGVSHDDEYCPRMDRIIAQSDQIINLQIAQMCSGYTIQGVLGGMFNDTRFIQCEHVVMENTK